MEGHQGRLIDGLEKLRTDLKDFVRGMHAQPPLHVLLATPSQLDFYIDFVSS